MDKTGDKGKTKAQLVEELQALRRQLAESQGREEKGRKRAEAALARESELLQALLDNSPDYIFFKDRESRFIKTNKAHAQNLLGVSDPREVAGKTDFDLYPGEEEDTQRFYDEEQRLMETGKPVVGREWTVPSQATGEAVWLSEHKVPIRREDGEIVGLVCIGRDVTARKQAEKARARRAVQLQAAAEVSEAVGSILDPGELIPRIVELVRKRFDLYYVGLFLVEDGQAVLHAGTGEAGQKMLEARHKLEVGGESMIGWCVANKEARIALDVGEEAVRFENPLLPETRSELALPLVSRGEVIGALSIQSTKEAAFTEDDITVLQTMADQVANATANARLYDEARRERSLLQALLDNSPDYLFFKDRESRFIRTNKAHAQLLLGLDGPQEAIGKTDFDLFKREEAQRFYEEEQKIMETGQPVVTREWSLTSSTTGEEVWLSEHKVPMRDETGQVIGLLGVSRDVTQLKWAEAALVRERDLMRTLLNSSPDYIFFKDRESRFIMSNDAHAQQLLGLDSAQEAIGKTDFDLFSHREAQRFYEEEQKIMETGQPVLGREWSLHSSATGSLVWLSEHKVPIRDETGRVIGLLGISRDVTQLKRAETEREQLFTTLERRNVQLQAAADVSSAASSMLDPNELIQRVVDMIRERFDLYYVGLFLVDQADEAYKRAVLRAGTGEAGRRMVKQRHELRVSEGHSMVGECIATGEARVEQDVSKAAVHRRNPLLPDTRSEMALPLVSRGEAIGALTIQSVEPLAFTEEDVSILQTMAGQVANTIENTRLYKQTEDALKELETIHRSHIRQSWDSYLKRGK